MKTGRRKKTKSPTGTPIICNLGVISSGWSNLTYLTQKNSLKMIWIRRGKKKGFPRILGWIVDKKFNKEPNG